MPEPDHQLLDHFQSNGNHLAFTELVRRHLGLVHATALRITANAALAEEVSQSVFLKLSTLRRPIRKELPLVVWLHRTTRSAAIDLVRSETRRKKREHVAASMATTEAPFPWELISPLLDEAIDALSTEERHLLLARYFQGKSAGEMAESLRLSEDAVRMRINRVVAKLREILSRRGITTTASALAFHLPSHAAPALPGSLVTTVANTALASAASTVPILSLGLILMTKKSVFCLVAFVLLGAGALVVIQIDRSNASVSWRSSKPAAEVVTLDISKLGSPSQRHLRTGKTSEDPTLVAKYGESRARLSRQVAANYIGFLQDLIEITAISEGAGHAVPSIKAAWEGSLLKSTTDRAGLTGELGLTREQQEAATKLLTEAMIRIFKETEKAILDIQSKQSLLGGYFLAEDELKNGRISREEFLAGYHSANEESGGALETLLQTESGESDFYDETLKNGFMEILDPNQAEAFSAAKKKAEAIHDDRLLDPARFVKGLEAREQALYSSRRAMAEVRGMFENAAGLKNAGEGK